MNTTGERFLTDLQHLCEKYQVHVVEEWITDSDGVDCFVGLHFEGPDFFLPITDMLLEMEDTNEA